MVYGFGFKERLLSFSALSTSLKDVFPNVRSFSSSLGVRDVQFTRNRKGRPSRRKMKRRALL